MPTTKIYYNSSKEDLDVLGVDVIPAGGQVSITTEFQPPVQLANYPGLLDITETGIVESQDDAPEQPTNVEDETEVETA